MTHLPRAVLEDLIPLYDEGELSAETRALIESSLPAFPELAARAHTDRDEAVMPRRAAPEMEVRLVRRTRAALALQRWLFGLAIGFSVVGLSLGASIRQDGVHNLHLMLADFPVPFGTSLLVGVMLWLWYLRTRRAVV